MLKMSFLHQHECLFGSILTVFIRPLTSFSLLVTEELSLRLLMNHMQMKRGETFPPSFTSTTSCFMFLRSSSSDSNREVRAKRRRPTDNRYPHVTKLLFHFTFITRGFYMHTHVQFLSVTAASSQNITSVRHRTQKLSETPRNPEKPDDQRHERTETSEDSKSTCSRLSELQTRSTS